MRTSGAEARPKMRASGAEAREAAFEAFWAAYPKKTGKREARKAFEKTPEAAWPKLGPALEAQKRSRQWQSDGGRYIPNPATWLNQGRWEDEAPEKPHAGQMWKGQDLKDLLSMLDKG